MKPHDIRVMFDDDLTDEEAAASQHAALLKVGYKPVIGGDAIANTARRILRHQKAAVRRGEAAVTSSDLRREQAAAGGH